MNAIVVTRQLMSARVVRKRSQRQAKKDEPTKGDTQVAWHHSKVEQLAGHPEAPQRLAAVPDFIAPLVICMLQRMWLPLNQALHGVECWKVDERVTAAHLHTCDKSLCDESCSPSRPVDLQEGFFFFSFSYPFFLFFFRKAEK